MSGIVMKTRRRSLLWRRVLDEVNSFLDVALEARDCGLDELLLVSIGAAEDVNGLLRSVGLQETSVGVPLRTR